MSALLSVGEFAQVTRLSIRTLRRYHDSGLLVPARVDEMTGYRYYRPDQIPAAQVIHQLRELDLPLAEVRRVIETADPDERADVIATHLRRLEDQLEHTRQAVSSLRQLLRGEPTPVELRRMPAQTVAGIEAVIDVADVSSWYAGAIAELDAMVPEPDGRPGGRYDNKLFTTGRGMAMVYLPTPAPPTGGRVKPVAIPGTELALTTHSGGYGTMDVTYGRLGRWVSEHFLTIEGPVHELYLCGGRDTGDTTAWRTEIGWPVFSLRGR